MSPTIRPLCDVAPDLVKEYLVGLGIPAAIAEWKYFDARFNQNNERGFVYMPDGRVRGLIGLIPFRLVHKGRPLHVAWSCDWSLERRGHSGLASLLLVKQSVRPYDFIFSSGGNATTRRIFSQIAMTNSPRVGLTLHAPMRLGCVLQLLRSKLGPNILERMRGLKSFPLRRVDLGILKKGIVLESGVSTAIVPLLERRQALEDRPLYDFEYLHWQIARCPTLQAYTLYLPGTDGARAAVLLWCATASRDFWRMALLTSNASSDELDSMVRGSLSYVYEQSGVVLSVAASQCETQFLRVLRRNGFLLSPGRRPLYVLHGKESRMAVPELRELSFLDTDWAYRLPTPYAGEADGAAKSLIA